MAPCTECPLDLLVFKIIWRCTSSTFEIAHVAGYPELVGTSRRVDLDVRILFYPWSLSAYVHSHHQTASADLDKSVGTETILEGL